MAFHSHSSMLCFFAFLLLFGDTSAQLSSDYYTKTCPIALSTIKTAVNNAVFKEHRMGASLLRLHFHDCFVNACSLSPLSLYISTPMHMHTHEHYIYSRTYICMSNEHMQFLYTFNMISICSKKKMHVNDTSSSSICGIIVLCLFFIIEGEGL